MPNFLKYGLIILFSILHLAVGYTQYRTCCDIPVSGIAAILAQWNGVLSLLDLGLFLWLLATFFETERQIENRTDVLLLFLVIAGGIAYVLKVAFFRKIITTGFACDVAKGLLDILALVSAGYILFRSIKPTAFFDKNKVIYTVATIGLGIIPAFLPNPYLLYYITYPILFVVLLILA